MHILAIETSCDETAAAVIRGQGEKIGVLSNIVSSQVQLHAQWGGVVPNLAAREHLKNIIPVIERALEKSKIASRDIDLIAVTAGPGLIPALLIGLNTSKTLSYLWQKPLMGIHHIEGHIYANFIGKNQKSEIRNKKSGIKFPILCLVVSGGHTQLIYMKNHLSYKIIGQTLDDAAGEAFDKVARILNLGYPGGPAISRIASAWTSIVQKKHKPDRHSMSLSLPRPMIGSKDFNFSFSGLKTAVLYLVKKAPVKLKDKKFVAAISHEFQQAVIDVLVSKTINAAKNYKPKTISIAGGVSANLELRKQLEKAVKKNLPHVQYQTPDIKYSLDNAAMIGAAAYFRWQSEKNKKKFINHWKNIEADANLKLK